MIFKGILAIITFLTLCSPAKSQNLETIQWKSLYGTTWKIINILPIDWLPKSEIVFHIDSKGNIKGSNGYNAYTLKYTIKGNQCLFQSISYSIHINKKNIQNSQQILRELFQQVSYWRIEKKQLGRNQLILSTTPNGYDVILIKHPYQLKPHHHF